MYESIYHKQALPMRLEGGGTVQLRVLFHASHEPGSFDQWLLVRFEVARQVVGLLYERVYVYIYVHKCMYMHICMYTCMYMYVYVYRYIHVHRYIYV